MSGRASIRSCLRTFCACCLSCRKPNRWRHVERHRSSARVSCLRGDGYAQVHRLSCRDRLGDIRAGCVQLKLVCLLQSRSRQAQDSSLGHQRFLALLQAPAKAETEQITYLVNGAVKLCRFRRPENVPPAPVRMVWLSGVTSSSTPLPTGSSLSLPRSLKLLPLMCKRTTSQLSTKAGAGSPKVTVVVAYPQGETISMLDA